MRPETKALYPDNWPEISRACIDRANHLCQDCGRTDRPRGVILTSHHKDYDPSNCADSNLVCLCQGCHLRRQARELAEATKYHRVFQLIRMGQLPLPGLLPIRPKTVYQALLDRAITTGRQTPGHARPGT